MRRLPTPSNGLLAELVTSWNCCPVSCFKFVDRLNAEEQKTETNKAYELDLFLVSVAVIRCLFHGYIDVAFRYIWGV